MSKQEFAKYAALIIADSAIGGEVHACVPHGTPLGGDIAGEGAVSAYRFIHDDFTKKNLSAAHGVLYSSSRRHLTLGDFCSGNDRVLGAALSPAVTVALSAPAPAGSF